jgi:hypothetical protein
VSQTPSDGRRRWVAIMTGAISVLIGVLYLVLITVLDSRGPMLPPPPEALGLAAAAEATPAPAPIARASEVGGAVGDPSPAGAAPPG